MKSSFWQTLPKPFVGLSPMDGVTDFPTREMQKKYGRPDLIYTEFTSVEGVCHGASRLLKDFLYSEAQRPIIAQIFGTDPTSFKQTAVVLCELGFDGIDINMGCPAKTVQQSGAGASLIKTPELATEIIQAVKAGIHEWQQGLRVADLPDISPAIKQAIKERHDLLPEKYQSVREVPVSVKTRLGVTDHVVDFWIPFLLEQEPAAIAVHGRTLKQAYGGEADWEAIGRAVQLAKDSPTLILGNGDVSSRTEAREKAQTYGVDGVLIGRASFGNPFVFLADPAQATASRFQVALEHTQLYEQAFQGDTDRFHFLPMRKHLGWYVRSVPEAREIRIELFQTNSSAEVEAVLNKHHLL